LTDATRTLLTAWISRHPSRTSRGNGWTDGRTLYWGREVLAHHTERGPRIRAPYSPPVSRGAKSLALALARLFPGAVQGRNSADVLGGLTVPDDTLD